MSNGNSDLFTLAPIESKAGPPTDMYFSKASVFRHSRLNPIWTGVAFGLGLVALLLIFGSSAFFSFLALVLPGDAIAIQGVTGFVVVFVSGLIFGLLVAFVYNGLLLTSMADTEDDQSWIQG